MTLAEIGSMLAVVVTFYGIFAQRRKVQSESVTLDAQAEKLRDEITRSVLATARQELERHMTRITALESELAEAQSLIRQLQTIGREKDQAMFNLQDAMNEREKKFNAEIAKRDTVIADLQTQITALNRGQNSGGIMGGKR